MERKLGNFTMKPKAFSTFRKDPDEIRIRTNIYNIRLVIRKEHITKTGFHIAKGITIGISQDIGKYRPKSILFTTIYKQ